MAAEGAADNALGGEDFQEAILQGRDRLQMASMIIVSPWQQDIDLTTKQGSNLWNEGTRPVEKFTGQGRDVPRFIVLVKNQVSKCYMTGIISFNERICWQTTVW